MGYCIKNKWNIYNLNSGRNTMWKLLRGKHYKSRIGLQYKKTSTIPITKETNVPMKRIVKKEFLDSKNL